MLVLSRKTDQDLIIGGQIRVKVLKVKGNSVRLGIEAPDSVRIVRGEIEVKTACSNEDTKLNVVKHANSKSQSANETIAVIHSNPNRPTFAATESVDVKRQNVNKRICANMVDVDTVDDWESSSLDCTSEVTDEGLLHELVKKVANRKGRPIS